MKKYRTTSKHNVLSMRISDKEKVTLNNLKQQTQKSVSALMQEALRLYTKSQELATNLRITAS